MLATAALDSEIDRSALRKSTVERNLVWVEVVEHNRMVLIDCGPEVTCSTCMHERLDLEYSLDACAGVCLLEEGMLVEVG